MMTKQRLMQYGQLKQEIRSIDDRIAKAEKDGEVVRDAVRGSTVEPPYALRTIVLDGRGSERIPRLSSRKQRCEAECLAIERYVENIADSALRQLLDLHFIEGHTYSETAEMTGYSESHVKRMLKKFFENMILYDTL